MESGSATQLPNLLTPHTSVSARASVSAVISLRAKALHATLARAAAASMRHQVREVLAAAALAGSAGALQHTRDALSR